jgi:hypothetical protein
MSMYLAAFMKKAGVLSDSSVIKRLSEPVHIYVDQEPKKSYDTHALTYRALEEFAEEHAGGTGGGGMVIF